MKINRFWKLKSKTLKLYLIWPMFLSLNFILSCSVVEHILDMCEASKCDLIPNIKQEHFISVTLFRGRAIKGFSIHLGYILDFPHLSWILGDGIW